MESYLMLNNRSWKTFKPKTTNSLDLSIKSFSVNIIIVSAVGATSIVL